MARTGQIQIVGLNDLLRDLKKLDKEAQDELREASKDIASRLMVPAYQNAADQAGPWGGEIAATVKAKRDRIPTVSIGAGRRAIRVGASARARKGLWCSTGLTAAGAWFWPDHRVAPATTS